MTFFEIIHIGTSETSSGRCGNMVTSEFVFTPTREGNGTVLKCQVDNEMYKADQKDKEELADTSVLRVVPGKDPSRFLSVQKHCNTNSISFYCFTV